MKVNKKLNKIHAQSSKIERSAVKKKRIYPRHQGTEKEVNNFSKNMNSIFVHKSKLKDQQPLKSEDLISPTFKPISQLTPEFGIRQLIQRQADNGEKKISVLDILCKPNPELNNLKDGINIKKFKNAFSDIPDSKSKNFWEKIEKKKKFQNQTRMLNNFLRRKNRKKIINREIVSVSCSLRKIANIKHLPKIQERASLHALNASQGRMKSRRKGCCERFKVQFLREFKGRNQKKKKFFFPKVKGAEIIQHG